MRKFWHLHFIIFRKNETTNGLEVIAISIDCFLPTTWQSMDTGLVELRSLRVEESLQCRFDIFTILEVLSSKEVTEVLEEVVIRGGQVGTIRGMG